MPEFDPAGYWEFHLASGAMRTQSGQRVVPVPEDVLASLISHAVHAGDAAALVRLGEHLGKEARHALGVDARTLAPEAVLGQAAAIVTLFGLGKLGLARWGDALVVSLEGAPQVDPSREAVAALLSGLFTTLAGSKTACVPVDESHFLLVHPDAEGAVRALAKSGAKLADVVSQLGEPS